MKINLKNIALATLLLIISSGYNLILAAELPPAPPEFAAPPGGGGGGVGPGSPASPIDMYQIALFAVAVILLAYFYKKTKLAKG